MHSFFLHDKLQFYKLEKVKLEITLTYELYNKLEQIKFENN